VDCAWYWHAPDGSFESSETLDPLKADVDEKRSATQNCTYSNGRDVTPKSYTVGASWTNSGVLTCADSSIAGNNFSGPYNGSGSVLSQENVTVGGTMYAAFSYEYAETFERLDPNAVLPVFTEVFTTTCDFVPMLKLSAHCETKYTYTGQAPTAFLADDVTQLVSAAIQ
jgi:aryl-phospho-beta-D-glucosidase BglC (GH1 family)